MTATIVEDDTDLSTFEAPAPPCDYKEHGSVGDGPAVWVITVRSQNICGCPNKQRIYLLCDACWTYLNRTGRVYCRKCFHIHATLDDIVSVERL